MKENHLAALEAGCSVVGAGLAAVPRRPSAIEPLYHLARLAKALKLTVAAILGLGRSDNQPDTRHDSLVTIWQHRFTPADWQLYGLVIDGSIMSAPRAARRCRSLGPTYPRSRLAVGGCTLASGRNDVALGYSSLHVGAVLKPAQVVTCRCKGIES